MIFIRTNPGLSNLRLFKGVDLVVFCEGGGPISMTAEEALSGKHHKSSDDMKFWQPMFVQYKPNVETSFRAVGSKNTLKVIARKVHLGSISGTCVVMDRDFDDLFDGLINHHRVLYTHKYSWESDLLETRVILHAFQEIAISEISNLSLQSKIRPIISKILTELRHVVRADIILWAAGRPLFPRNGSIAVLRDERARLPPALDIPNLKRRLAEHHAATKGFFLIQRPASVSVRKHCYGKLFLAVAIQTLHYLIHWRGQPKLANDYCKKFLIRGFHAWIEEKPGSAVARYYSRAISAV